MYKNIGIFLLGAAIGSFITYRLIVVGYDEVIEPTEVNAEPKSNDMSVDRLAEELALYQAKKTQIINVDSPVNPDNISVEKLKEELNQAFGAKLQVEKKKIEAEEEVNNCKVDYTAKAKQYVDAAEEIEEKEVEFVSEPSKRDVNNEPYVIDIEEFSEGEETFDKITVYYYEYDNILIEAADAEDGEPEDIDATIGWGSLDCFGEGSVNPDIVYVRNEKLSIDYEVIRLRESYETSVLGYEK